MTGCWQIILATSLIVWTCGEEHKLPKKHSTIIGNIWEWNSYLVPMLSTGNSSKQEAETFPLFWFIGDLKVRSTVWFWNNLEMPPFQYKADLLYFEASSFAWKLWEIHPRVCVNKYLGILLSFFFAILIL